MKIASFRLYGESITYGYFHRRPLMRRFQDCSLDRIPTAILGQPRLFRLWCWIMNADGSRKRRLTSDSRYRDECPQWSRDGQYILFTRLDEQDKAGVWSVRVANDIV